MSQNAFLQAVQQYDFFTENGALSHSTTGSALVDYFAKCGTYRDREQEEVNADLNKLWNDSPLIALMIVFYVRNISRKSRGFFTSTEVQKGQGARDEFRKAIVFLATNHPEVLQKNLWLIPVVGCWRDLWHEDLINVLDRTQVYDLVQRGMQDEDMRGLVAKYLPRIRSKGQTYTEQHKARNEWARGLCKVMGWSEKEYRQFKSNPAHSAHQFQRVMSAGLWDELDFSKIPGKALFKLVSKRGKDGHTTLERHNQIERYTEWIKAQPVAKFTGYVYELLLAARGPRTTLPEKLTFDRQFDGLIEQARKDRGGLSGNVWCALDTSGSMMAEAAPGVTAFDICVGMGIFFATLNEGAFKDHVIMFDCTSYAKSFKGTFTEKVQQIMGTTTAWGSTNFQSVIDAIVDVRRKNPKVPLSDFPETLLVVSDMQFNAVNGETAQTNYDAAMEKLAAVGLPKINIIWWWVTGRGKDFPSTLDDEGVTMIGGFDGSVVTLLLGGDEVIDAETGEKRKPNAYESMLKVLDQEVLRQVKL